MWPFNRNVKAQSVTAIGSALSSWLGVVGDWCTGAWQRNIVYDRDESLLRNSAIYACVTGISSDLAKMRIKLCENKEGIWEEITSGKPWLAVLRKPNHYQNRIAFIMQWILSKLLYGNAYVLIRRDNRNFVNALYVLNPHLVTPLVTVEGDVYYSLNPDPLSRISESSMVVPASQMIHDMMPALWHPLVGVPPLYACAAAGTLGNRIQKQSTAFFDNQAMPGGVLTIPGDLTKEKLEELKEKTQKAFSGENKGKMMVLTNGMTFNATQATAEHAQIAEQLKLTREDIAMAFHYPLFKLGGPVPTLAGNVDAMITTYYTDCLQALVESMELCLDEGLALPANMGTELDLDNLMRLDTTSLFKSVSEAIGGGWMSPNEGRYKTNYKPVLGGESPMIQQQNYSLAALAKRDAKEDPFENAKTAPASPAEPKPSLESEPANASKGISYVEMMARYNQRNATYVNN